MTHSEGENSWNILPPNPNTISQHTMKIKLFLLGVEQIHLSVPDYKKKLLESLSQILCTEKLQYSTPSRAWSLLTLFRQKYPSGEGSRHISFLYFFKGFFSSFQDGRNAILKQKSKCMAFTTVRFSRNLEV